MKKTYWLKIAVLGIPYFFNFSTVLGQDFKGMNKEELRTNLTQSLREVDSLTLVVDGLRRDLTNKTNQIAIGLREQSSLKDVNNKLKIDLEAIAFELDLYKIKVDSLSDLLELKQNESYFICDEAAGCMDFEYDYIHQNGCNTPNVTPIGWSIDGKFAYRVEFCDGGCGCCGASIVVYDTKQSRIITNYDFDLSELENDSEYSINSYYEDLYQKLKYIIDKYKIIPIGSDIYIRFTNPVSNITRKRILRDENEYEMDFEEIVKLEYAFADDYSVELNSDLGSYQLSIFKSGIKILSTSGKLDEGDISIPLCPGSVDLAGYIKSPYDDKVFLIALMLHECGFENEADYKVKFVGFRN